MPHIMAYHKPLLAEICCAAATELCRTEQGDFDPTAYEYGTEPSRFMAVAIHVARSLGGVVTFIQPDGPQPSYVTPEPVHFADGSYVCISYDSAIAFPPKGNFYAIRHYYSKDLETEFQIRRYFTAHTTEQAILAFAGMEECWIQLRHAEDDSIVCNRDSEFYVAVLHGNVENLYGAAKLAAIREPHKPEGPNG